MNSSNNQLRGVLWDLDGTLIDSMPYHWQAWRENLEALGYHFTLETFKPTIGLRNEEIVNDVLKLNLSREALEQLLQAKEQRYRRILRERGLPLLPGARRLLSDLKSQGWRQAIASSAPRLNVEAVLQATDLGEWMDAIVCAEDVTRGKPEPEPFLLAATRLAVQPDHCLVVEDAPVGLEGARRAGMQSIGVLTTYGELQAGYVVKSLEDLTVDTFEKLLSPGDVLRSSR
jgi:beta-phosphoglucomutase